MDNHFDAIIIGSGMGGLTCASLLAQLHNKRVLIIERHFTVGGYTHMFRRKNIYEWDVGLHYVGEMYKGSRYRTLFDFVTAGQVDWTAMPECYDRFLYPDFTFDARRGAKQLRHDLIWQFPHERTAIERYFKDVTRTARWYGRFMLSKLCAGRMQPLSRMLTSPGSRLALMSTRAYLDAHFSDPSLKGVLASQWGNFGLPPHRSAFAMHALAVCHMFDGGYYPVGGAKAIAQSIIPLVEAEGGQLLVRHSAEKIILDQRKAIGVEAQTRIRGQTRIRRFYADRIISDAGAYITYTRLIPDDTSLPFRNELDGLSKSLSHVCLYLGFKESPEKLGFKGENHWIFGGYDHDELYRRRHGILNGDIHTCFVSFPSLKDPKASGHIAELITFLDYDLFSRWAHRSWKKRGLDYEALKARIAAGLVALVESRYRGFAELIDYQELSTPLTVTDFTGHRKGAVYGLPGTPEKFSATWLTPRTPIENLYLTGADIGGHGIVGAFMGGILTTLAASNNRRSLLRLLLNAQRRAHK